MAIEPDEACFHILIFSREQDPFREGVVSFKSPEERHFPKPVDPLRTRVFVGMLFQSLVPSSLDLVHFVLVVRDESPLGRLDGLSQCRVNGVPNARTEHPFVLDLDCPGEILANEPHALARL